MSEITSKQFKIKVTVEPDNGEMSKPEEMAAEAMIEGDMTPIDHPRTLTAKAKAKAMEKLKAQKDQQKKKKPGEE
jgi:hypothetical protein